jgi:hypothetical protein
MSEAKKPGAMVEIHPGSPEWKAWLAHHRGTKTEARMLSGLVSPARPWLARSKMPPDAPRAEGVTRSFRQVAVSSLPTERSSAPEGRLDEVDARLSAFEERRAKEAEIKKRRRKEAERSEAAFKDALTAVSEGRSPYVNGGDDLGTIEVGDPLEADSKGRLKVRTKIVNLRDDPVGRMAKRGHLGNAEERDIRLKAARHWQRFYEHAEIGGARGIDPTRDVVDGGEFVGPDTNKRVVALERLGRLGRALGLEGENLVRRVLGEKMEIREVAAMQGMLGVSKKMDEKVLDRLGWRFRECLDTVAAELGYAAEGKRGRAPRDDHAEMARYANSPGLHRAVHRARSEH